MSLLRRTPPAAPPPVRTAALLPFLALLLTGLWTGCGSDEGAATGDPSRVLVVLDKSDPGRLLRYYFGAYAAPEGADPVAAGIVVEEEGRHWLDLARLEKAYPGARAALAPATADGRLEWEELVAFVNATYRDARRLPPTLAALQAAVPYAQDGADWMRVDVDGVMTSARRHIHVPYSALRSALRGYSGQGERLIYPVGTTIVGEHHDEGRLLETTVMQKRADGQWDFFVYGADGRLAAGTSTPPRPLSAPTQCVGCHFGTRLFEPERHFPADAPAAPHGPQAIYVEEEMRDPEVVALLNEHARRSDTVLGLYNTLFLSRLRAEERAGRLSDEDAALLRAVGL